MKYLLAASIIVFTASRFIYLDADPPLFKRSGDISDEGYWSQQARAKVLFGAWLTDDFTQGIAAAPLYTLLSCAVFACCGVSLASARLVNAAAGAGCVFLLYLIVRRFDRGLALVAAFILAVNDAFFMYNRIGLPETLVIFFILAQFWFLVRDGDSRLRFWGGGICFALAVLSKLTAFYFAPVVVLYLAARCARKEADLPDLLLYLAGVLIVAVPAVLFYYLPLFPCLEMTLSPLSRADSVALTRAPFSLIRLAANHYFSIPSVFLLLLGSLAYAWRRGWGAFFMDIRGAVRAADGLELLGLCWILGLVIGVTRSHMADRRVVYFIIPLVLLSAMLYDRREKKILPRGRGISPLSCAVFGVPFLNMAYLVLPGRGAGVQCAAAVALAVITLGVAALRVNAGGLRRRFMIAVERSFADLSLVCLVAALSLNFAVKNGALAKFIFGGFPPAGVYSEALVLAVAAAVLLVRSGGGLDRAWQGVYLALCGALVILALGSATFSARDASRTMAALCEKGQWIIGPLAHELSYENRLKPLLWIPNDFSFEPVNRGAMARYRPGYYLRIMSHDGKETHLEEIWPTPEQVGEKLVHMDTLSLWPVFGKPRAVLKLYRIEYSKKEEGK